MELAKHAEEVRRELEALKRVKTERAIAWARMLRQLEEEEKRVEELRKEVLLSTPPHEDVHHEGHVSQKDVFDVEVREIEWR